MRNWNWGCIGIILLLAAFWLLVGLAVKAVAYEPTPAHMDKATALAQYVWHPACTLSMDEGLPPSEDYEDAAGWAALWSCHGTVNEYHDFTGYPDLCDTILHEGGHAIGMPHSERASSIMYPLGFISVGTDPAGVKHWTGVDRRCLNPLPLGARQYLSSPAVHPRATHSRSLRPKGSHGLIP